MNFKFIDEIDINDWEIETDTGWEDATMVGKTIQYDIWELELENNSLECADTHIIFDQDMNEVFCQDLSVGDLVQTKTGLQRVISVRNTNIADHMYDISVDSDNHRYYTNDILSHNTTSAAGYLLWFAMFVPDATVLIAAHKYSGAQEIMSRIRYAYEYCPDFIRAGAVSYNKGTIEFDNGSRIVSQATTENTGRGMSLTLLYMDEFAFVRNTIAEEFWTSISPTLATGGKCIITSTPNSDEDQFAQIWKAANRTVDKFGNQTELGENGFKAFTANWWDHPDRDEMWKEEEMGRIGEERFRREHGCEFLIFEETLVSSIRLTELRSIDPIEKHGQVRWFKKPTKGHAYMVGLDPSMGTGGDNAGIQVFELPDMIQVGEWMHNKTAIPQQVKVIQSICDYLSDFVPEQEIYYSVENNSLGEAALISIAELGEENIKGTFLSEPKKPGVSRIYRKGFTTSEKSKISACAKLKTLIETDRLTINSNTLLSEIKSFVATGRSFKAKIGDTDDLVMATILVVRMAAILQEYDPTLEKHLRDHLDSQLEPLPIFINF